MRKALLRTHKKGKPLRYNILTARLFLFNQYIIKRYELKKCNFIGFIFCFHSYIHSSF